jgi:hypothetical protein
MVYDVTIPKSHSTIRIMQIVHNIVFLLVSGAGSSISRCSLNYRLTG